MMTAADLATMRAAMLELADRRQPRIARRQLPRRHPAGRSRRSGRRPCTPDREIPRRAKHRHPPIKSRCPDGATAIDTAWLGRPASIREAVSPGYGSERSKHETKPKIQSRRSSDGRHWRAVAHKPDSTRNEPLESQAASDTADFGPAPVRREVPTVSAHNDKLHGLELLPEGKKIGDVHPVFAGVEKQVRVGNFSKVCASCRKPFNAVRKARKEIRLHAVDLAVPIAWSYPLCGSCVARYERGANDMDAVLAAVEAFHLGEVPSQ